LQYAATLGLLWQPRSGLPTQWHANRFLLQVIFMKQIGTLRPILDYMEHEDGSMHSATPVYRLEDSGKAVQCPFCSGSKTWLGYYPMPACPVAVARLRQTMKELENDGSL
jgi:hypothetical protein